MISVYYRRYWLQVLILFLWSVLLSLGAIAFGSVVYSIFHILVRRAPGHDPVAMIIVLALGVFLASLTFTSLFISLCRKRPDAEPFRYSPHFEKYFFTDEDEALLNERLANAGFEVESRSARHGFIRATLTRVYEGSEPGDPEIVRQPRRVTVEARFYNGKWQGRIFAKPIYWFAFYDGASLARIAVAKSGEDLGLSLQSDTAALTCKEPLK